MIKKFEYIITKEEKYYVAQCLNVDVSTFGETINEAKENLKEALEVYYEGEEQVDYNNIENIEVGDIKINI